MRAPVEFLPLLTRLSKRVLIGSLLFLTLLTPPTNAEQKKAGKVQGKVTVDKSVCMVPCSVTVTVTPAHSPRERRLYIGVQSENWMFEEERDPAPDLTTQFPFHIPYPGDYEILVVVSENSGETVWYDHKTLLVQ
jgi:hypothetical protein